MSESKKPKSKKKKSNLVDFQKEKSAKDFSNSIMTGELYNELKPKKAKSEKTT